MWEILLAILGIPVRIANILVEIYYSERLPPLRAILRHYYYKLLMAVETRAIVRRILREDNGRLTAKYCGDFHMEKRLLKSGGIWLFRKLDPIHYSIYFLLNDKVVELHVRNKDYSYTLWVRWKKLTEAQIKAKYLM